MSFGNGSGQLQFTEVLPSSHEHGVFHSGEFSSDQVVGNARISGGSKKYRKKKQKGGDSALEFSAFTPDAQAAAIENPSIDAALNSVGGEPLATNGVLSAEGGIPPVEGGQEIAPSITNPAISIGGKRTRKRKSDKKKQTKKRKQSKKKKSRKRRRGKK